MSKVIVIGGGTAGITLALRLLQQSTKIDVTLIDAGPYIEQGNRRKWLDYVSSGQSSDPYAEFKDPKNEQDHVGVEGLGIRGSRYFGVGGTTNVWGGWCVRYKPEDFFLKSNTGEGADWPFDYSKLEPYYKMAEETLWVAGHNKPNPAIPYTLKDGVIIEAFQKMGIANYEPLTLARRPSCVTIGTCKYCPIRKRYIAHDDLDEIAKNYADRFTLLQTTVARELKMRSKSECASVLVYNTIDKTEANVDADVVVLAAGAIESPKLLLLSTSSDWKSGVGNDHSHVGKHITAHPLVRIVGTRAGNPDNLEQPVDFPTLACREFDTEKEQKVGKLFFVRDGRKNFNAVDEQLLDGRTVAQIRNSMRDELPFELRGFIEVFSDAGNMIGLGSSGSFFGGKNTKVQFKKTKKTNDAIEAAESKLSEILKTAGCRDIQAKTYSSIRADHSTSTCRMSTKPEDGVVDQDLKVHGVDNLFICSNAVLPNGSAVNPTLTLIALTERLSEHLTTEKCS